MDSKIYLACRFFICVLIAGFIGSCASVTLFSVDIQYKPSKPSASQEPGTGERKVLIVSSFIDARRGDDTLIIGAVVKNDGHRTPVVPKYARPADAVTVMVKDYLSRSGYGVVPAVHVANGKPDAATKKPANIMVGGEINELEVLCHDSFTVKKYTTRVKLTVLLSETKTGKVFYTVSAESRSSLEHYRFSEKMLAEQINEALSDAVEKLFEGNEVRRKISEVAAHAL